VVFMWDVLKQGGTNVKLMSPHTVPHCRGYYYDSLLAPCGR